MPVIEDTNRLAQLSGMVSDEEKKIERFYTELGKAYFELHKEDTVNEFKVQINSIKDSYAKIEEYQKTIKEVKGLVPCPQCGKDIKKTDAFCTSCGFRVVPVEEPKPVEAPAPSAPKCTNCGAVVPKGSMFCTVCGTKVEAPKLAVSTPAPVVAEAPKAPATSAPKCTNCGAVVPKGSMFCTVCGTKVDAPKLAVSTPAPVVAEAPKVPAPSAPKCTNCGAVISKGSMFCTACGTKVEAPKPAASVPAPVPAAAEVPVVATPSAPKCTNCGAVVPKGSMFCTVCGTKVEAPKPTVATPAPVAAESAPKTEVTAPVPVAEVPKPVAPMVTETPVAPKRFCINCGKEVAVGAKFCIYCGNKQ